ncbi:MAG: pyridoxal-dependent decarboxylase [Bacteroidales bacterium]|jgi:L-2,4-diaminobutyrate decarboxylase
MDENLKAVYQAENFKTLGYKLIDLLSNHLTEAQHENIPVMNWHEPAAQLEFWKHYQLKENNPIKLFEDILERSIHIHHPKYIGHQVCPPAPVTALASLFGALLNNGMAIYEMGGASTAIEKVVVDLLAQKVGYQEGDGFITSGGTLGNLTALLAARQVAGKANIWENGLHHQLGVMVSGEAHYSVDRALRVMGFGAKGIIKIPVGENYTMRTELLEAYFEKAKNEAIQVIGVVGSAPSTSTGMFDDLEAIARFCISKKIWFHVDAAHGGGAVFSEKYKHLLKGIEKADSVVIDGHKMLMMPGIMTFVLFRNKNHSYATFSQKAQYLLSKTDEEEWYNLALRSMECTKLMMSVKFYSILQVHGEQVLETNVDGLFDLGMEFAARIKQRKNFELALEPHSNIVCFRYVEDGASDAQLNDLNSKIRHQLLVKGEFYIVQTKLNESVYMRSTLMNPFTTPKTLNNLLDAIERIAREELHNI